MEEENHMLGYAILDIHTGEIDAVFVERNVTACSLYDLIAHRVTDAGIVGPLLVA